MATNCSSRNQLDIPKKSKCKLRKQTHLFFTSLSISTVGRLTWFFSTSSLLKNSSCSYLDTTTASLIAITPIGPRAPHARLGTHLCVTSFSLRIVSNTSSSTEGRADNRSCTALFTSSAVFVTIAPCAPFATNAIYSTRRIRTV